MDYVIAKGSEIDKDIDIEDFFSTGNMVSMNGYVTSHTTTILTVKYHENYYHVEIMDNKLMELRKI